MNSKNLIPYCLLNYITLFCRKADIAARRELSHSRRVLSTIEEILYGYADADYLGKRRGSLNEVERKVNDLIKVID